MLIFTFLLLCACVCACGSFETMVTSWNQCGGSLERWELIHHKIQLYLSRDGFPTGHLLPPNKASHTRTRTGLQPIELLSKGTHRNSQTTQTVAKTMCCSLQTNNNNNKRILWWKQHQQNSSNIERVKWCLLRTFTCFSVFGVGEYSTGYQTRRVNTDPAVNPLIYNAVLPTKIAIAMVAQSLWEKLTNVHKMGPILDADQEPETR